jgi:hypothetical protein
MSRHRVAKERQIQIRQTHADEVSNDRYARAEVGQEEVARLAYLLWEDRGRPQGTAEEDWFRAVAQLRAV